MVRTSVWFASLISMATFACGGKPPPPAAAPINRASVVPVALTLDGSAWTIAGPAGLTTAADDDGATVTGPGWSLSISAWPASQAFVRSLAEQLDADREMGSEYTILHQVDGGVGGFELVTTAEATTHGTVLVPGPADGAMCIFKLDEGADWHPPLEACRSLRPEVGAPTGDGDIPSGLDGEPMTDLP